MATIDWIILICTLCFIVIYGVWKTRGSKNVKDYILGNNEARWWTVGLSVMATQASAITFLSTPGQAFHDGMGFVQFYFGLPLAMIVICMVFIPIYHNLKVYTAYEFLENRFDLKTRSIGCHPIPYSTRTCSRYNHFCPFHYPIRRAWMGFKNPEPDYRCFSDHLHGIWWNQGGKCYSKTTDVCHHDWNVCSLLSNNELPSIRYHF